MPSKIRIGCRVSGAVGPFLALVPGTNRRKRARLSGTVVASLPDRRWRVYWDGVNKASDHHGPNLRFEQAAIGDKLDPNLDLEFIARNWVPNLEKCFVASTSGAPAPQPSPTMAPHDATQRNPPIEATGNVVAASATHTAPTNE